MNKTTKNTLAIFFRHAWRYKWRFSIILLGIFTWVAIDVYRPFVFKQMFEGLAEGPAAASVVFEALIAIAILGSANFVVWRIISFANNHFQTRVMSDLMNTCYRYVQKHSVHFFDNSFVGSIVTKVRRFASSFETLADNLTFSISGTVLKIISILAILTFTHPVIALYLFIWIVIYLAFAYFFAIHKYPYDEKKVEQDTATTAHLADTIANHQNIKLFASYEKEVERFEENTERLFKLRKKSWNIGQIQESFQVAAMLILELLVLFTAYQYWQADNLSIGDFAFLQAYLMSLFDQLWNIGRYIRTSYESIADANEMTEMLQTPHDIVDVPNAKALKVKNGEIEFKKVGFAYHSGNLVLDNFNLTIKPGERVALVGESGGGKSTIVKALLRVIDLTSGQILIDGQDISKVTQDSLREQISLVPQDPILFHRSLLENIRYGKPEATEEEVVAAAKAAHCHEFITSLEKGYETLVGERGVKLSGGERQRVAIARAILRNSPILILDEATSSLDSESESYIQEALQTLMKDKTTIVVAHRLSTIKAMDRIVVISSGKIIEEGKHEELLKAQQGQYQKLWDIQVGGFNAKAKS